VTRTASDRSAGRKLNDALDPEKVQGDERSVPAYL